MERRSTSSSWPDRDAFTLFCRPDSQRIELDVQPALASWDAKDHPSQRRLAGFLGHVEERIRPATPTDGPLAVRLKVGLPAGVDPLKHHDLDNYLDGLGRRIEPGRSVAFFGSKTTEPGNWVDIAPAKIQMDGAMHGWGFAGVLVSGSAQSTRWKEQIEVAVGAQAEPAAPGPLVMQVAFVVGPRRQLGHALEAGFGRTGPDPRDG